MTPDYKGPWVALYIKTIYGKTFNQLSCAERSVFLQGLFLAARVEYDCSYDGHFYHVLPGQFVVSQRGLAKQCGEGCSRQIVRDTISKLEADGTWTCLRTQSGPQSGPQSPSLITFMHWGLYQRPLKRTTQSRTHRTTQLQPTDSIQPLMNGGENDALPCSYNVDTKELPPTPKVESRKARKLPNYSCTFDYFAGSWEMTPVARAKLEHDWPGIDLDTELKKSAGWALDNVSRPVKNGLSFLSRWLAKPGCQMLVPQKKPVPIRTEEEDRLQRERNLAWLNPGNDTIKEEVKDER